ncbi:hypothetical protein GWK47_010247 [Chionoecetes opilio]|uniref:Uncharacterized protein n=1 Tax=Chionoecetes opilio TaxID=41210 RepID=A0A8J4Y2Z7_CHIOP|nr:hypothetical protein GWK47_010247 [Chionoecetes opilio]
MWMLLHWEDLTYGNLRDHILHVISDASGRAPTRTGNCPSRSGEARKRERRPGKKPLLTASSHQNFRLRVGWTLNTYSTTILHSVLSTVEHASSETRMMVVSPCHS